MGTLYTPLLMNTEKFQVAEQEIRPEKKFVQENFMRRQKAGNII